MIKINNLHKNFGDLVLFNRYNLHIKENELVAIVGESGSGKSTLLNIIGSLENYQEGDVIVDDILLNKLSRRNQLKYLRNQISFVFQNYALMEDKNVIDNILLGLKKDEMNISRVKDVLENVGLKGFENRVVITLSGGEQQRVALARAMIKKSKVILADEPTGNLDESNSKEVLKILMKIKEEGKTIVVVTHDTSILKYFDRVISLDTVVKNIK